MHFIIQPQLPCSGQQSVLAGQDLCYFTHFSKTSIWSVMWSESGSFGLFGEKGVYFISMHPWLHPLLHLPLQLSGYSKDLAGWGPFEKLRLETNKQTTINPTKQTNKQTNRNDFANFCLTNPIKFIHTLAFTILVWCLIGSNLTNPILTANPKILLF